MASNILGKISKERTVSAIVIVVAALVSILPGGIVLAAVLYVVSVIGFLELTRACGVRKEEKINSLEITGIVAITCYYPVMYFAQDSAYAVMIIVMALIAVMSVYVFGYPKYHANQVMDTYFALIYAPVMLSFVFLTRQLENGIYLVWMIFISSWISDTFAYLAGVLFGRHKLAPVLSPKKSIEGSVGGIVGAALFGALFGAYMDSVLGRERFVLILAVVGGVGSVISQVGDLAASAIKRNHDIKDYGKLIPGHGGIMDRFDSVIFTAPITYYLIIVLMR
ncbi:MAG: phosphatidate cytidylyltransferase [Lachnospiraceae bacterium]|nr:phosphatidate cytidylyltransferase [Lachnospiraceae bacterium]MDE7271982.1 phosphatidate cytidylyltransferase [Lachnospiraceae bacterium]